MRAQLDHLVIAARSLGEGVRWCQATLGVTPLAGGPHALMGTHNCVLSLASTAFPRSYLEILAIDPAQRPTREKNKLRWFDLDDPLLQHGLARHGPRLIHFVARVPDARATTHALAAEPTHIARGSLIEATRQIPNAGPAGLLVCQITVRDDGQRLFYGTLPTLIQWGALHPADALPDSGVTLDGLALTHPRAATLCAALRVIGLGAAVPVQPGAPNLLATLSTPRGVVTLESKGL